MADRLISVDLLQQASDLLQHQVDNRLQGAARAQVAAKLAMVQLKNRKPDLALRTLRGTRMAELPREVREQRLLLEARATSEIGRHDLALAILESMSGKDVDQLRADILWAAKRYGEAAEAIERAYGTRWKTFAPLADNERYDILRAAVGYALADDILSLERFRSRYAAKMADGPDRGAFEAVSTSFGLSSNKFAEVARAVSTVDTLDRFLKDYRTPVRRRQGRQRAGGPIERRAGYGARGAGSTGRSAGTRSGHHGPRPTRAGRSALALPRLIACDKASAGARLHLNGNLDTGLGVVTP